MTEQLSLLQDECPVTIRGFVERMLQMATEKKDTDVFIHPLPFTIRGERETEEVTRMLAFHFDRVRLMEPLGVLSVSFVRR